MGNVSKICDDFHYQEQVIGSIANRQTQEYTDTHVFTTVYDQDSFEPVARLVRLKPSLLEASNDEQYSDKPNNPIQIYHYHNDHLGTPNELTNNQGEVVWLADYEAWGNTAKVVWHEVELQQIQIAKDELQPIRFQGQYVDQETGLHYNRFRYYDPDVGMFISRDPIGLMGGLNIFQYAPNPLNWIDPLGLTTKCLNTSLRIYNEKFAKIKKYVDLHNYTNRENRNKISGGVSGAIGYTKSTGILVKGSDHIEKGRGLLKGLKRLMRQTDNAHDMCDEHKKKLHILAEPYIRKLKRALKMPQKVPLTGRST